MKKGIFYFCLLVSVLCLLLISGCSQVQMSPAYARQLELSAMNVAEFNKRCQAGNDEACRRGLARASETLNLLVDALHAVDSTAGGDPNGQ